MDTNNFNENIKLKDLISKESLFLVFLKDGTKQWVIAENESDFPIQLSQVLFAANFKEFEEIINEMSLLMSADVNKAMDEIDNILNNKK